MTAFRRFISASGMTNLADGIAVVAWGWIASLLTRDALLVALVPVTLRLPWALLALPAGLVTDRVDRRRLILGMDAVRALAFLGAALALWDALPLDAAPAKGVSAPELYGALLLAAFLVGGAEVFRDNAAQIMLPALVPKDWLERANGQLWSAELLTNALIGPGAGGLDAGPVLRGDGVLWLCLELVSVSTRQRMIPDALLGRVNSIYRLLAWGMMPLGLVLSGLVVSLGEASLARSTALVLPFWVAGAGSIVVTVRVWGAIQRGFAGISR
jgi:hypothetical protein